ncbi:hypothetical protein SLG_37120 [Sphingobium sp. SYK-6]|uniref:PEPxxWA-CTERM sorting domain-containing protein n=1 Tax=Sphingobium sp. (strain NBRC 103272 / SYK-6) TaxID=627192 RepID=UPI0002277DCF|nr:PEPxxWA-CTERM sorting domain-containing protein [Sphingobium sp. SYK-6]BAK68387.1 hypothetical protein SLG_37120 [Sphingobium sp. SYK-6]
MIRVVSLIAIAMATASLPAQGVQATVTINGRISQVVGALHSSAHLSPDGFAFSVRNGATTQQLFTGIEGVRAFNQIGQLNSWANGFGGSSYGSGYSFTHSVLGSYFTQSQQGGGYRFTHSVLDSYFGSPSPEPALTAQLRFAEPLTESLPIEVAPIAGTVPEPATWAMLIAGFAGIGALMRRRSHVASLA